MGCGEAERNNVERETLFTRLVLAFVQRDFATVRQALREDVVLILPGSSPFAGVHRGVEAVGRFLLGLRRLVVSEDRPTTFLHEGDALIADP
jgi:ketosteroid isomerase-like protein